MTMMTRVHGVYDDYSTGTVLYCTCGGCKKGAHVVELSCGRRVINKWENMLKIAKRNPVYRSDKLKN